MATSLSGLRWSGLDSHEGTKLKDTPKNRAVVEARARVIGDEISEGSFDYLRWFPDGNLALGVDPLFIARQTGTSLEMIEEHYGRVTVMTEEVDALIRELQEGESGNLAGTP